MRPRTFVLMLLATVLLIRLLEYVGESILGAWGDSDSVWFAVLPWLVIVAAWAFLFTRVRRNYAAARKANGNA